MSSAMITIILIVFSLFVFLGETGKGEEEMALAQMTVPYTITNIRIVDDTSRADINFGNTFGAAISLDEILAGTARAGTGITIASLTFDNSSAGSQFNASLDCDGKIYIDTGTTTFTDIDFPIDIIIDDPGTSTFSSGDTLNLVITVNTSQTPKGTTEPLCEPTEPAEPEIPEIFASPVAVSSVTDNTDGFGRLAGARDITTVAIGSSTYALVASLNDDGVQIIDISNPTSPTAVSSIAENADRGDGGIFDELDNPRGITTVTIDSSTYALVASGADSGVQVIDISNPATLIATSSITDGEDDGTDTNSTFDQLDGARGITTVIIDTFTYALVASVRDGGVQIINMTNPASPTATSSITNGTNGFDTLGGARAITTATIDSSTYALVASGFDSGVQIIDISDPTSPTAVSSVTDGEDDGDGGTFDELSGARAITTVTIGSSTYALVASTSDDGVQIINITDPAVPTAVSSVTDDDTFDRLDGASDITTVTIGTSTYALVTSSDDNGVQIINISDPTSPTAVSSVTDDDTFDRLGGASSIAAVKIGTSTYAIVAAETDNGVQIIRIADTQPDPEPEPESKPQVFASPIAISSVTDGVDNFNELDGAVAITTVKIGQSTYALVASRLDNGVQIIDITNPATPTVASSVTDGQTFDTLKRVSDIITVTIDQSTYALVTAAEDRGVQIIDITNPAVAPIAVYSVIDGDVDGNGNTFDELNHPLGITTVQIDSSTYALVVSGFSSGRVQIIDISDPSSPTAVSSVTDDSVDGNGNIFDTLSGGRAITTVTIGESLYALVASLHDSGVQIIDITNPSSPTATSSVINGTNGFDTLGGSRNITTVTIDQSTYALVTSRDDHGVQIINISNPEFPTAVSSVTDGEDDGVGGIFDELNSPLGITTVTIDASTYALVASGFNAGVQIINISDPASPTAAFSITDGSVDRNGNTFDELSGPTDITTVTIGQSIYALVSSSGGDSVQIIRITSEPVCELTLGTVSLDFGAVDVGTTSDEGTIAIQNSGNVYNDVKIGADFWCTAADNGCTSFNGVISPSQTSFGTSPNTSYASKQAFVDFLYDTSSGNLVRGVLTSPFETPDLFTLKPDQTDTVYLQTLVELISEDDGSQNRFTGDISQEIIFESECSG